MSSKEKFQVKICIPASLPAMLESNNNQLQGVFAPQASHHLESIAKFFNTTYIIDSSYPGLGNKINSSEIYTGCLGKLQNGQADVISVAMDYPSDIINVSQGFIIFDEKVSFMGAFARPDASKPADFTKSLKAFDLTIYLLVIVYLIIFAVVIEVRRKIVIKLVVSIISEKKRTKIICPGSLVLSGSVKRRIKDVHFRSIGFFDIIRHYIRSNFIQVDSFFINCCTFILTLFSFFTFVYLNSRISTELVIPENAKMYKNYDEIMEAGVKPVFLEGMSYYKDLKFAPEGSKGKIFWNWAVDKFGEKNLFIETGHMNWAINCVDGLLGEILIFSGEVITSTMKTTSCDMLGRPLKRLMAMTEAIRPVKVDWDQYEDSQAYIRTDESAKSVIKSLVIGRDILQSKKYYLIAKFLFSRMFEYGLFQGEIKKTKESNIFSLDPAMKSIIGPPSLEKSEIKNRCKQYNIPIFKEPEVNRFIFSNLKFSSLGLLLLISCSALILAIEKNILKKKCK